MLHDSTAALTLTLTAELFNCKVLLLYYKGNIPALLSVMLLKFLNTFFTTRKVSFNQINFSFTVASFQKKKVQLKTSDEFQFAIKYFGQKCQMAGSL